MGWQKLLTLLSMDALLKPRFAVQSNVPVLLLSFLYFQSSDMAYRMYFEA
jgi:hypothetical protein